MKSSKDNEISDELKKLSSKYIHKPWEAPPEILSEADVRLGDNYPKPMVDLKESRDRALEAFKALSVDN